MDRYFKDVKVGDIVYDKKFGKGKVIFVDDTFEETFTVSFPERDEDYNKDGKLVVINENMEFIAKDQTLFYEKDLLKKKNKNRNFIILSLNILDEKISFDYKSFETQEEAENYFKEKYQEYYNKQDRYNLDLFNSNKFIAYNLFERVIYMMFNTNITISYFCEELIPSEFIRLKISKEDLK